MKTTRRDLIVGSIAATVAASQLNGQSTGTEKFVRFQKGPVTSYGIVTGETVEAIQGDLFGAHKKTGVKHKLGEVKLGKETWLGRRADGLDPAFGESNLNAEHPS